MLKKLRSYMMPIAMIVGGLFSEYVSYLSFCTPYLIGIMLFITYCNISFKDIRFSRLHIWLLTIQLLGSVVIYFLLKPIHPVLAQGAMICILAPTATAAPVITNMLGGNTANVTAYSLLSNLGVAIVAPIIFTLVGDTDVSLGFWETLWAISRNVVSLLLLPLIAALSLSRFLPQVHSRIKKMQGISFYLWSLALVIITGRTVQFVLHQGDSNYLIEIIIALAAFIICVGQFLIGRNLGKRYNDTVAGGQGLGQKNTILSIWMAQTYLNPIASIGPGAYILWQNIINSYQVWKARRTL